ncbi:fic family toxin-antitoxin system, toxin component [Mangrovactinospora gilvigrisea]|uniref:Fic family toxin-antitoxin system, toxin component n=1 Tax=Mangrovactinospora gilvigrisea TaxID=1428644 RepID=A0A1J7BKX9_9ACTN|nr:fic family toxin-antitoxin system, toxin component [Mangrovactinospora gilvigrisea]OIV39302.1 fic family toxin-antitoxin system, toxin component [Mangrovactinospora gilvigrisea]
MTAHLADVQWLLRLAETLPDDPSVDELGVLFGACGRHAAHAMGQDVYASDHLKAAALLHELARVWCLEHSNLRYAWAAAAAFLAVNGHRLDYRPEEAVRLVQQAHGGTLGVRQIAHTLRTWTRTT